MHYYQNIENTSITYDFIIYRPISYIIYKAYYSYLV